ncbi:MAG: hypothetical protein HF978_07020 [Desulfobacteraceae bacterium]|nr:hypothetical protein [Desulfobacteraceae bacterium]MBC2755283.1 hypothetical protein [Desulfobacteraceae bacterium]
MKLHLTEILINKKIMVGENRLLYIGEPEKEYGTESEKGSIGRIPVFKGVFLDCFCLIR